MALLKMNFSKFFQKLVFVRILNHGNTSLKSLQYSSQVSGPIENRQPVKYTTNEAYNIRISETLGFKEEKEETFFSQLPRYLVLFSTFGTLAYFGIFREENEIDDILKGEEIKPEVELINLKLKLSYCKKMKLPTDSIRARIEELENSIKHKSSLAK